MKCLARTAAWLIVLAALTSPDPAVAADIATVFDQVNPSVVVIHATERQVVPDAPGLTSVDGLGSGCLVSDDGLVLTAAHVVHAADSIEVAFLDGTVVGARVLASDPGADVAMLRLDSVPSGATVARWGDSDAVRTGDQVFVIGAPYGIDHTLTVGYVSGRHEPDRAFGAFISAELLQTDAAINQGNSGGPMFNLQGEVIGVVSHIMSQSGGSEGLGFVVTSNMARELLIEQSGFWSGVQWVLLAGEMGQIFNIPPPGVGILVTQVAAKSPAEKLGLRAGNRVAHFGAEPLVLGGDIVLEVMDAPIGDFTAVRSRLRNLREGVTLRVTVLRGGKKVKLVHQIQAGDLTR